MFPIEHLHPMILHFPIVLAFLLIMLDGYALARGIPLDGRGAYATFSLVTAVLAGISALVTMMAGDMALDVALSRGVPETLLETHEGLGTTTAIVLAAWAALRVLARWRNIPLGGQRKSGIVVAELAIAGLISVTAFYGGALVYQHGVNVIASL